MNTRIICRDCGYIEYVAVPLRGFHPITDTIYALCIDCAPTKRERERERERESK